MIHWYNLQVHSTSMYNAPGDRQFNLKRSRLRFGFRKVFHEHIWRGKSDLDRTNILALYIHTEKIQLSICINSMNSYIYPCKAVKSSPRILTWKSRLSQPKLSEEKVNGSLLFRLSRVWTNDGKEHKYKYFIYSNKCHENWRMLFSNKYILPKVIIEKDSCRH